MWHHLKPLAFCAATLALAAGCTHTATTGGLAPSPAPAAAPAPAQPVNPGKGTIAEVIQAGRYSYISVDSGSGTRWYAVPYADMKVGQKVEVQPGMEVKNYLAKSLNRTFDSIFFSEGLTITTPAMDGREPAPTGHGSVGKLAGGKKTVEGKIVEVVEGSEFDFLSVETAQGKSWVALPSTFSGEIRVGMELKFLPGEEIRGFKSGAVNRTFDRIIFAGGIDK